MNENPNPSTYKSIGSEKCTRTKPFGRVFFEDKKKKYKKKKK